MSQQHRMPATRLIGLALAVVGVAWLAAPPATSPAQPRHESAEVRSPQRQADELRRARAATRKFRDVTVARAAGYAASGACAEDPKYGGMGIHYANPDLVADGKLDVTKPEILVYQPTPSGKLRLGAVEYLQVDEDQDLATDPDRPYLFGMPFDGPMLGHEPGMPIHYDLHVWLYRHNPAGRFAMWNPRVRCPDTESQDDPTTEATQRPAAAAAAAARSCRRVPYSERTQAKADDGRPNAAGVVFQPEGDKFKVWDNLDDGKPVSVYFNYAGVADKWKFVISPVDGRATSVIRNLNERYRHICFQVRTWGPDSPIVRYTTRP
jgi:hypothetical protein